ncbi:MAG: BatA and WFA domain-containing protein, partial [Lentisphaeria bacterium]|nr:BatA and WFA domain-containing protein [Lentisphaeria bacterium]
MTGFGVHTLVCAWLFALLAPLIVFYFLKLRRPRHNIPSLALWKRVIEDRRVNSPFQRFKRNILLLLQILLLCLLVLAAMRPFFSGAPSRVSRLPVLIDCSGSMGALDKLGGSTRLEAAKAKIAGIIDGMGPDQRICLLAVDNGARRITDFTDNRRLLHQALEDLQVRDVPSDLEEAMRMTAALAREYAFGDILLVSDGNLPEQVNATLSFEVDYQLVPPAGSNTGIVAMNAR